MKRTTVSLGEEVARWQWLEAARREFFPVASRGLRAPTDPPPMRSDVPR